AQVAILGDPKATLPELTALVAERMGGPQKAQAQARLERTRTAVAAQLEALRARARADLDKRPIQPLALHHAIAELLPANAVVVDESISSSAGLRQFLKSADAQSFFGLRGGGIG